MDFDPMITSDGSGYGLGHVWLCNFHYGYGQDVIDEDVENEKSCMQVLQLLIAKADAEIHDLEDELAILQCQLNWAESDCQKDPYELFCAVFKRKIDFLTSSVESLRNINELYGQHNYTALAVHRPAERIRDVIYALIRPNFPEFDGEEGDIYDGENQFAPSTQSSVDSGEPERCHKVSTTEGNSKSDALRHGESKICMTASKIHDSGTSSASDGKAVTIKAEEASNDAYAHLDAYYSISEALYHKREDPLRDHQKAFGNHSGIRCSRKKSSLSSLLKPERHRARRKTQANFRGVKQPTPTLIFEKIGKSKPYSDTESSGQSRRLHFNPEISSTIELKIEEDLIYANPFQAKRRRLESTNGAQIKSSKVKEPEGEALGAVGREMTSRTPQLTEVTVGSTSAVLEVQTESPSCDLKSLRLQLSKDSNFLATLTVRELKDILRQHEVWRYHKLKKEKLIEMLTKLLGF